jgi:Uma2 family endonuclease
MSYPTYRSLNTDPPLSPRKTLPTMYDLPSEDPEEPGLPDEFHDLQPDFLSRTCRTPVYPPDQIFSGTDMNLYYDVRHQLWHKRPDWFLVLGVPRLYDDIDLRSSYVMWQEGVSPFVIVELLSPGTAKEDLGENFSSDPEAIQLDTLAETTLTSEDISNGETTLKQTPPRKWEVYERILRVPYYVVFSRYTNRVRFFKLEGGGYREQSLDNEQSRLWIPEIELGLGLWQGEYKGITRLWLRWYDASGNWVLTDTEEERQLKEQAETRAEQSETRAEQAELQLRQVVLNLLQSGMAVEQVATITGLSIEQVQQLTADCK